MQVLVSCLYAALWNRLRTLNLGRRWLRPLSTEIGVSVAKSLCRVFCVESRLFLRRVRARRPQADLSSFSNGPAEPRFAQWVWLDFERELRNFPHRSTMRH